ncbi:hypothetical protein [Polaribacter sp. SA4-12]|uniref:hypothetical protein n=1 Tax=Polaribacter sp. SA4-12 TaxID=1312072 RepID=UPI000B3CF0FB|nr:hypothetical protein [Polaribacter sp. SA4-12]ARV16357.1 hypothetical protein BTO07_14970 [Polaribacter sp. SA4-12]
MKTNEPLKNQIFEIIENQIRENNPKETNITYKRLIELGYSKTESKQFMSQYMAIELLDVLEHKKPFNEVRYVNNLKTLPKEPSK